MNGRAPDRHIIMGTHSQNELAMSTRRRIWQLQPCGNEPAADIMLSSEMLCL